MIIKLKTHLLRHAVVLRIYPFYEKNAFCSRSFKSCLFIKHSSSAAIPCSNDSVNYPTASSSELFLQLAMPAFAKVRDLSVSNIVFLRIKHQRLQINFTEVKVPEPCIVVVLYKDNKRTESFELLKLSVTLRPL